MFGPRGKLVSIGIQHSRLISSSLKDCAIIIVKYDSNYTSLDILHNDLLSLGYKLIFFYNLNKNVNNICQPYYLDFKAEKILMTLSHLTNIKSSNKALYTENLFGRIQVQLFYIGP